MNGRFVGHDEAPKEQLPWGELAWVSQPTTTQTKNLVVIAVDLLPGEGHNFHKHPQQEEVIYVLDGEVEQWIETEKRRLGPGDAAFIDRDTVHASFNTGGKNVRLLAILGPAVGEAGYELVDVSEDAPWSGLR